MTSSERLMPHQQHQQPQAQSAHQPRSLSHLADSPRPLPPPHEDDKGADKLDLPPPALLHSSSITSSSSSSSPPQSAPRPSLSAYSSQSSPSSLAALPTTPPTPDQLHLLHQRPLSVHPHSATSYPAADQSFPIAHFRPRSPQSIASSPPPPRSSGFPWPDSGQRGEMTPTPGRTTPMGEHPHPHPGHGSQDLDSRHHSHWHTPPNGSPRSCQRQGFQTPTSEHPPLHSHSHSYSHSHSHSHPSSHSLLQEPSELPHGARPLRSAADPAPILAKASSTPMHYSGSAPVRAGHDREQANHQQWSPSSLSSCHTQQQPPMHSPQYPLAPSLNAYLPRQQRASSPSARSPYSVSHGPHPGGQFNTHGNSHGGGTNNNINNNNHSSGSDSSTPRQQSRPGSENGSYESRDAFVGEALSSTPTSSLRHSPHPFRPASPYSATIAVEPSPTSSVHPPSYYPHRSSSHHAHAHAQQQQQYHSHSHSHSRPPSSSSSPQEYRSPYTPHSTNSPPDRHYVLTSSVSSPSHAPRRSSPSQPLYHYEESIDRVRRPVSTPTFAAAAAAVVGKARSTPIMGSPLQQSPPRELADPMDEAVLRSGADPVPTTPTPTTPTTTAAAAATPYTGTEKGYRLMNRIPPPIRTKWSHDLDRECPPLTFQSQMVSSSSHGGRSADSKMSPSTPRSTLIPSIMPRSSFEGSMSAVTSAGGPMDHDLVKMVRPPFAEPYTKTMHVPPHQQQQLPSYMAGSGMGYHTPGSGGSTPLGSAGTVASTVLTSGMHLRDREDHDMEHCSEQDDVREREDDEDDYDRDDDDHDRDDDEGDEEDDSRIVKRRIVTSSKGMQRATIAVPGSRESRAEMDLSGGERSQQGQMTDDGDHELEEEEEEEDHEMTTDGSTGGHHGNGIKSPASLSGSSSARRKQQQQQQQGSCGSANASPKREESSKGGKSLKPRAIAPRPHLTAVQAVLEEALDQLEDDNDGQEGAGPRKKGLFYYAPRVCDRVQAKMRTTYNELVAELDNMEDPAAARPSGQDNIRRRVYDALNILEALGIIDMDKKEIRWVGIQGARTLQEASRKISMGLGLPVPAIPSTPMARTGGSLGDGADESEEPEDDEMEIEKLQKEVDAMKLQNSLEMAKIMDQVSRHVQLNNLVTRNKLREEKDLARQERRRQRKMDRKEERRAAAAAATDTDGTSMAVDSADADHQPSEEPRRRERRHRHRSPRHDRERRTRGTDDEEDDQGGEGCDNEGQSHGHGHHRRESRKDPREMTEEEAAAEEEARRVRKQERRERKERKEKREKRRQEREAVMASEGQRIHLPLVMVRIPGYAGQSSDSEASISVMRRVREEHRLRKNGKGRRHSGATGDETSMVEIKIPHQEELSIISDTEVLGDLGLNNVTMAALEDMLSSDLLKIAQYSSTTATAGCGSPSPTTRAPSTSSTSGPTPMTVTVRGGFERELICVGGH